MGDEVDLVYFQQDGESAHHSNVAGSGWTNSKTDGLEELDLYQGQQSPHLSPLYFWLCSYLRGQVCVQ